MYVLTDIIQCQINRTVVLYSKVYSFPYSQLFFFPFSLQWSKLMRITWWWCALLWNINEISRNCCCVSKNRFSLANSMPEIFFIIPYLILCYCHFWCLVLSNHILKIDVQMNAFFVKTLLRCLIWFYC